MTKLRKDFEPPVWPLRVLSWFYDDTAVEGITGDLLETYDYRLKKLSRKKALWYFYRDALSALKPGAIKRTKKNTAPNAFTMFTNYFKLTLRNVKANPTISIISILGLAISISCCITLFVFGKIIVTANNFIQDSDNIHLIYSKSLNT